MSAISVWSEHTAADGKKYYFNSETNASVWEKPDELKTEEERLRDSVPWKEHRTADGKFYYFNRTTKETTWDCPADLAEVIRKISIIKGTHSTLYDPKYNNFEDAKNTFKQCLRDCAVPSTATWETVVKLSSHDPRFEALLQTNEKKKVFNTYKQIRAKEEKALEAQLIKENASKLRSFLENSPQIHSWTRYSTAHSLFRTQEVWYSVPDRERRDILDDIQPILAKKERNIEKETSRINQRISYKFFKNYRIFFPITTKWVEALEIVKDRNLFEHHRKVAKIFTEYKEDALIGYENYIYKLEEFYEKEQTKLKHIDRQKLRINRENFEKLLLEYYEDRKLDEFTKFKDFWPIIKTDPRCIEMLKQSGSNILDLFKFFQNDLKGDRRVRHIIKKLLKSDDLKISKEVTFDKFFESLPAKNDLSRINKIVARSSYNQILSKFVAKQEYKKYKNDKLHKIKCDEFFELFKLLDPPLKAKNKWDEIWPHLVNEPEYKNLEIESERIRIFKKFMRKVVKKDTRRKKERKETDSSEDSIYKRKRKNKESLKSPRRESPIRK